MLIFLRNCIPRKRQRFSEMIVFSINFGHDLIKFIFHKYPIASGDTLIPIPQFRIYRTTSRRETLNSSPSLRRSFFEVNIEVCSGKKIDGRRKKEEKTPRASIVGNPFFEATWTFWSVYESEVKGKGSRQKSHLFFDFWRGVSPPFTEDSYDKKSNGAEKKGFPTRPPKRIPSGPLVGPFHLYISKATWSQSLWPPSSPPPYPGWSASFL